MALKVPTNSNNNSSLTQEPLEPATYNARLVQIIDLGLQPQRAWQGKEKAPAYMINLTYELCDEFMKDENGNDVEDKPRWISEMVNLSPLSSEKAKSTMRYKAFDSDNLYNGDFSKCLGTPVTITIANNIKDGKVYNNISAVAKMRERDANRCPPLVNDAIIFDLDDPDLKVFEKLPQFIRTRITSNLEYKGSKLEKLLSGVTEETNKAPEINSDDCPF